MKEVAKGRLNLGEIGFKEVLYEIILQLSMTLMGFLSSRAMIFSSLLPFGIAFTAAVPKNFLAMSALGSFIGYFIPISDTSAFRYLAALFAVVSIKALLFAVTKYAKIPLLCGIIAFATTLLTGAVATSGQAGEVVNCLIESAFAFSGTYFISKTFKLIGNDKNGLSGRELVCLLITITILLTGVIYVVVGGISVGKILCISFILVASRFGEIYAGAVCGIITGFAVAATGGNLGIAVMLVFSGLVSGASAPRGKYAQVVALLLSLGISGGLSSEITETVELLIEALFGSAVYLLIPKGVAVKLGKLFSPPTKTPVENSFKKSVTMRLRFSADALSDVSQTVEGVAKELSRINSPTIESILNGVENDACSGCSLCIHCWESRKNDTVTAVFDIIKGIKEGSENPEEAAGDEFRTRCLRPSRVSQATQKYYTDYASSVAAESRLSDVRSVVSDQFDGISNMLKDMAQEFENEESFEPKLAEKISSALKNIDIRAEECSCQIDKYGRMSVELVAKSLNDAKLNRMKILRQAELCCERNFEPPVINEMGGKIYITLTEKAVITADIGIWQISSSPSGICGDAYNYFLDGKGRFFMILSDGMGSGGRAAVDGAMASGLMARLLRAGFGYDCSLRIVNSSMLFKSTDESLATVDVTCVDLFSGRCDLLKAGAAPTVVRRNGKSGKAQSTSLPAGILRDVGFDKASVKLRPGDIVIMMSDGVTSEGTEWICAEADAWQGRAQDLAEHIAKCAKRRRSDNHSDDITVMAAIIERAV